MRFLVSRLKRRLHVVEMARLQGLTSHMAREFLDAAGGDEKIVGQGVGDAMSLNVLMRVLPRALDAAGLIDTMPLDVWARHPPAAGILRAARAQMLDLQVLVVGLGGRADAVSCCAGTRHGELQSVRLGGCGWAKGSAQLQQLACQELQAK